MKYIVEPEDEKVKSPGTQMCIIFGGWCSAYCATLCSMQSYGCKFPAVSGMGSMSVQLHIHDLLNYVTYRREVAETFWT